MANGVNMLFKLLGQDVSASKTLSKVGREAKSTGGVLAHMGATAGGVFAGIGASAAASKITDFAKDSVNAYQQVGGETLRLQRYMGGTAEDASRLAHAFTMTGVDSDAVGKNLGILSKHLAANDKAAKSLGISFRDAQGHLRPMGELLPEIAEKFKTMPNGPEKTARALALFGRGGMALMPFLNKGKAGIAELTAESDKLGTTLSGKDLDAVKENTKAKRTFGEAVKGLQLAVGRELYPAMTLVTKFMAEKVVPVVRGLIDWMKEHKDIVTKVAAVVGVLVVGLGGFVKIVSMVTAVVRAFTAVQAALNVVMAMNPVMLIVLAIAGLIALLVAAYFKFEGFRKVVDAVWGFIKTAIGSVVEWIQNSVVPWLQQAWQAITAAIGAFVRWFQENVLPKLKFLIGIIVEYYKFLWTAVSTVFRWIADRIGGFIQFVQTQVAPRMRAVIGIIVGHWNMLKGAATSVWNFVTGKWGALVGFFTNIRDQIVGAFQAISTRIVDAIRPAWNLFAKFWNDHLGGTTVGFGPWSFDIPKLPFLAAGGIVTRPTLAVIGEAGPEAVLPLGKAGGFGGGQVINVTVHAGAVGSKEQLARTVVDALRDAQNRGLKLGLLT